MAEILRSIENEKYSEAWLTLIENRMKMVVEFIEQNKR